MVLLAGIECYREAANVVIYDTDLKAEILNYKSKAIDPNDHAGISLLFQPFQFHQNMDVCCISLENIYNNQFRKNLINIAKSTGFKSVKIIDWCSSLYCYLLSLAEYSLKPNENVWLFYELPENGIKNIYIWKKAKQNAYLCQIIPYIDSINYLENIQSTAKCHKPSLILYPNNFNCFQNLKTVFTTSEIFVYGTIRHVKGALVKARILAKDPAYEVYNATPVLDKDIKVDYNKEQILSFYMFENLPSKKSAEVIEGGGNVEVFINDTSNNYPIPVGTTKLTVQIDMNGIVNLDFKNQNNKQQKKQNPKNLSAGNPKPPKPPKTPKTNKATNLMPSSSTTASVTLKEGGKKKQPKNVQPQNNITVNVNNNPAASQKPAKQPNLNKNRPRKPQTAATAPEAQAQAQAQAQAPVNVFVSYQPDQRLLQQPQCYPAFVPMAPTAMPQLQPQQQFYPQPFLPPQMQSMQPPPKQERRPRQKQHHHQPQHQHQHQQQQHQQHQQQYPTPYYNTPTPAPPTYYQATNYPQQNFQPLLTNPLFSMDSINSNPAPKNNMPTKEGVKNKNTKKQ